MSDRPENPTANDYSLPADFETAAQSVHTQLDVDKSGYLSWQEVEASKLVDFKGSENQVKQILLKSDDNLPYVSNDQWFNERGVSAKDLTSLRQLMEKPASKLTITDRGVLTDLEICLSKNTHSAPVMANLITTNFSTLDKDSNGEIKQSEIDEALKSDNNSLKAPAEFLNNNYSKLVGLSTDKSLTGVSLGDTKQFQYYVEPGAGLISEYGQARQAELALAVGMGTLAGTGAALAWSAGKDMVKGNSAATPWVAMGALVAGAAGYTAYSLYRSKGFAADVIGGVEGKSSRRTLNDYQIMNSRLNNLEYFNKK